jgi:hypothetical protein
LGGSDHRPMIFIHENNWHRRPPSVGCTFIHCCFNWEISFFHTLILFRTNQNFQQSA